MGIGTSQIADEADALPNKVKVPCTGVFVRCRRSFNQSDGSNTLFTVYEFTIQFRQFRWSIVKRFSEFVALHAQVTKHCPPIDSPEAKDLQALYMLRKQWRNRLKMDVISGRIGLLWDYLATVLATPSLWQLDVVRAFVEVSHMSFLPLFGRKGKEGTLWKMSGGRKTSWDFYRTWTNRWFVCKDSFIAYFKSHDSMTPMGTILIVPGSVTIKTDLRDDGSLRRFVIITSDRRLTLQAASSRDRDEWVNFLQEFYGATIKSAVPANMSHPFLPFDNRIPQVNVDNRGSMSSAQSLDSIPSSPDSIRSSAPSPTSSTAPVHLMRDAPFDPSNTMPMPPPGISQPASFAASAPLPSREHEREAHKVRFPSRPNTPSRWFVDAKGAFESIADALDSAREQIMISGWFISPELMLKRGTTASEVCPHEASPFDSLRSSSAVDARTKPLQRMNNSGEVSLTPPKGDGGVVRPSGAENDGNIGVAALDRVRQSIADLAKSGPFFGSGSDGDDDEDLGMVDLGDGDDNDDGGAEYVPSVNPLSLSQSNVDSFILPSERDGDGSDEESETLASLKWRLDNLLQRKAEEGVEIYVLLYKEIESILPTSSLRVRGLFENLHPNIRVIRHPNHSLASTAPFFWSHHDKLVVVDQNVAFLGGLDLAFGRYDDAGHALCDPDSAIWPGKHFYNPCVSEWGNVESPFEDLDDLDRTKQPRMPWHDCHVAVGGLAARDLAFHFIQRWNHHRISKGELLKPLLLPKSARSDWYNRYHSADEEESEEVMHVRLVLLRTIAEAAAAAAAAEKVEDGKASGGNKNAYSGSGKSNADQKRQLESIVALCQHCCMRVEIATHVPEFRCSTCNLVQRSPLHADVVVEKSKKSKKKAEEIPLAMPTPIVPRARRGETEIHLSSTSDRSDSSSSSPSESPSNLWSAVPAATAAVAGIHHPFAPHSRLSASQRVFGTHGREKQKGEEPAQHCDVTVLRSASMWSVGGDVEQTIHEAYLSAIEEAKHSIYIENQFFISSTTELPLHGVQNRVAHALIERIAKAIESNQTFRVVVVLPLHPEGDFEVDPALRAIMHYQYRTICRGRESLVQTLEERYPFVDVKDYIVFLSLRTHDQFVVSPVEPTKTDTKDDDGVRRRRSNLEDWDASVWTAPSDAGLDDHESLSGGHEAESEPEREHDEDGNKATPTIVTTLATPDCGDENDATTDEKMRRLVTEMIYVHSKLMIVDDRIVIVGSANINDRSMNGDRDSEIAVRISGGEEVASTMGGNPWTANRFALTMRINLWEEHLGFESTSDDIVKSKVLDPICDEVYKGMLIKFAIRNTVIYHNVFPNIPNNRTLAIVRQSPNPQQQQHRQSENAPQSTRAYRTRGGGKALMGTTSPPRIPTTPVATPANRRKASGQQKPGAIRHNDSEIALALENAINTTVLVSKALIEPLLHSVSSTHAHTQQAAAKTLVNADASTRISSASSTSSSESQSSSVESFVPMKLRRYRSIAYSQEVQDNLDSIQGHLVTIPSQFLAHEALEPSLAMGHTEALLPSSVFQ
eukprot:TRINITY_DN8681_c0_g1_i1.p1 TRINITY_DN8681_c0_g1~~TRINITY_DN8681_c0_g1_i1.p1  ORF type:complete len:1537 (+),score=341.51 TRINITY_DN8681_c0_g1_i1:99-4709(+)